MNVKITVTARIMNAIRSAWVFLTVCRAQSTKTHASTAVENEAFDPGYGHQVNIGVKSESQQNNKPSRTIIYSKTY